MVLWEITLGTAYFLGLKRTYKLALKIQRKLIGPKHPKIRDFVQRRTRYAFDVALKVHRTIQERDIEVGRNFGNWILRWLDKMKPQAQIRSKTPLEITSNTKVTKPPNNSNNGKGGLKKFIGKSMNRDSNRHLFSAARNMWPKPFPAISIMIRPPRPLGNLYQYRQYSTGGGSGFLALNYGRFGSGDVIRNDIRQFIMHN